MNFKNKVVLVTGASVGIGEVTALMFAQYGARLILVARNQDKLNKVAAECKVKSGLTPLVIVADLSTDEGVEKTANETLKNFDKLDVLVNNAGIGVHATIEKTDMDAFDRVFNLNVRAVYDLTRRLVPALLTARGNIVNVTGVTGSMVFVGTLPYSMTKAALDHFTRLVALELAPKGVRVNAVSTAATRSEFMKRVTGCTDEQDKNRIKNMEKSIPIGRVANGEHVAHAITFLASDAAELITGAILPVDGAISLAGFGLSGISNRPTK